MWFVTLLMGTGFAIISWSAMGTQAEGGIPANLAYKFWFSLGGSTCVGCACALGESNLVAFLKRFPHKTVGYWSSGTGIAGLLGTTILLALNAFGFKDWQIYILSIPMLVPYLYCCLWLVKKSHMFPFVEEEEILQ